MFYTMWFSDNTHSLYEAGVRNDKLCLLYLMCTTTMDKLCQLAYNDENILYKYRVTVAVPLLEMVDNIITTSKCGSTSVH